MPKQRSGIRILATRRRSVSLGSDVPKGTSFTTEPVRIHFAKAKKAGFEFSRLDVARSGSALTCQRARHSPPSPFESLSQNKKGTLRCLFCFGGKIGIRTLVGVLAQTRFPVVRLRPTQPSFHRVVFYHKILIKSRGFFAFRRKNK